MLCGHGLVEYVEEDNNFHDRVEKLQDQLILCWMLSSFSAMVLMSVTTCKKLREAWKVLKDLYGSEMRTFSHQQ